VSKVFTRVDKEADRFAKYLQVRIVKTLGSTDIDFNTNEMGTKEMAEDSTLQKVDPNLVADIVSSYVGKNIVAIDQLGGLIATVHQTLRGLSTSTSAPPEEKLTPAVPIRRSVQPDYVVCLECGVRAKTLRRHLRTAHALEPAAYRARWKLAADYALTAPAYAEHRSAMAKQLGLGRKRAPAEAPTATRRGRSRRTGATE
jgi:predicted transcriptional regulator